MIQIARQDVVDAIERINRLLPQVSETTKRSFKGDYTPQYGGWLLYYYDENGRATAPLGQYRVSHKEAYRFFDGIEFSLNKF